MSFNFNPQPHFLPDGGLPTAAMHPPIPPTINIPVQDDFASAYHEGAVRINQGNSLSGDVSDAGSFNKFVCSFWMTNLTVPTGAIPQLQNYWFNFAAEGSFDTSGTTFTPFPVSMFVIQIQEYGGLLLMTLNPTSTARVSTYIGCPNVMGRQVYAPHSLITPAGVWHHYIVSYDGATQRCQIACDRGGGPAWGGGVMDSGIGFLGAPAVTFHAGSAPQAMWSGFTLGVTSFSNPPSTIWRMQAPTSSLIDIAYFYLGVSNTFFDLTTGNLDFFVTPSLTPVNLGRGGSNVPLTCLTMHTGNAVDPFLSSLRFQFPYNAATGRLWGGTISDAPTQPPIGA